MMGPPGGSSWRMLALALCSAVAIAALSVPDARAAMNEISLRGAGAMFSAPLYNQWIEAYHRDHPTVSITYDAVGSGEGCGGLSPARSISAPATSC